MLFQRFSKDLKIGKTNSITYKSSTAVCDDLKASFATHSEKSFTLKKLRIFYSSTFKQNLLQNITYCFFNSALTGQKRTRGYSKVYIFTRPLPCSAKLKYLIWFFCSFKFLCRLIRKDPETYIILFVTFVEDESRKKSVIISLQIKF